MAVPHVAITTVADTGSVRHPPCRDLLAPTILLPLRTEPSRADPAADRSAPIVRVADRGADEVHRPQSP